jgi:hypothetical protein
MKRLFLYGITIVGVLLIAMLAWSDGRLPWQQSRLNPDAPAAKDIPALQFPDTVSDLIFPISVPMSVIQARLNQSIPKTLSGTQQNVLPKPATEDTLTWSADRGDLVLTASNNAIMATTGISGTARIRGKGTLVRGSVGRWLGRHNPTSFDFSAHANIAADASLSLKAALKPDWHLRCQVETTARLTKAEIPIKHFGSVSVRGALQPEVDKQINTLNQALTKECEAADFLQKAADGLWKDMHQSLPIAESPKLWAIIKPVEISAQQPAIDAGGVNFVIGIKAATTVVSATSKPPAAKLAKLPVLKILGKTPPGRLNLKVPVMLQWDDLNAAIEDRLDQEPFSWSDGQDSYYLRIKSLRIAPYDHERIMLDASIEAGTKAWLKTRVQGHVYLTAKPEIDTAIQQLRFTAIDFDSKTSTALDAMAWIAKSKIIDAVSKQSVLELEQPAKDARQMAQTAFDELAKQLQSSGVVLSATPSSPTLDRVAIGKQVLGIIVSMQTAVSATVASLKSF